MRQTILFLIAALLLFRGVAQASVDPAGPLQAAQAITQVASSSSEPIVISLSLLPFVARAQAAEAVAVPATAPVALKPLYGSLVGLQAFDFYSTRSAITSGVGREGNPALREVAGSPAALLAVKAGTTAAIILSCERLRKNRHPVAAVALMIGVNSAYAIVAAHNFTVLQHRR